MITLYLYNKTVRFPKYCVYHTMLTVQGHEVKKAVEVCTAVSVMRYEDHTSLYQYVRSKDTTVVDMRAVMVILAQLTNTLHGMGLYHGNMSAKSVFVTNRLEVSQELKGLNYSSLCHYSVA